MSDDIEALVCAAGRLQIGSSLGTTLRIEQNSGGLAWAYHLLSWKKGGLVQLEDLLAEAGDLNAMNCHGETMLQIACEHGHSMWSDQALARLLQEPQLDLDLPGGLLAEQCAERRGNRGAAEMICMERQRRARWAPLRVAWVSAAVRAVRALRPKLRVPDIGHARGPDAGRYGGSCEKGSGAPGC